MSLLAKFAAFFGLRRKCKQCGEYLRADAEFCSGCGSEAPFRCTQCGTTVKPGIKFCTSCGNEILRPEVEHVCEACGARLNPATKYCPGCGARRDEGKADRPESIKIRSQRWEPDPGQFAVRLDQLDLGEMLEAGVVIEPGVLGVLMRDGEPEAPLLPGRYRLGSLPARRDGRMFERADVGALVLVCSGDQILRFAYEGLKMAERVPVSAALDAVIRVRDPLAFAANVLAGAAEFRVAGFLRRYDGQLRNAIEEAVAGLNWDQLRTDAQTKQRITALVGDHLREMLERDGMELVALRAFEVRNPDLEQLDDRSYQAHLRRRALNSDLADFEVQFDAEVAALDQRSRQGDVTDRRRGLEFEESKAGLGHEGRMEDLKADHQVGRDQAHLEQHRRRAAVMHQMEEQLVNDRKLRLTSEEELAAFVQRVDKDRLLRQEDLDKLKRDLAEARQDQEAARAHLTGRLRAEREFELRAAKLKQDQGLAGQAIDFQLQQERTRLEHDLDLQRRKLDAVVAARKATQAAELEAESQRRLQGLELNLAEARGEAEKARIRLEVEKAQDEHDLAMAEKKKALDLKEQRERMALAMEVQQQRLEATLKAQAQQFAHQKDMKLIDVDLEKTRITTGGEVVEHRVRIEEARRREEESRKAYEREQQRMQSGLDSERTRSDSLMDRMERLTGKLIDSSGKVITVGSGAGGPAPSEEMYKNAMEQMGRVAAAAAGRPRESLRCPKCSHVQESGSFCEQCGGKLGGE